MGDHKDHDDTADSLDAGKPEQISDEKLEDVEGAGWSLTGPTTSIPGGDQFIPGGDQFIPGGDQFIPGGNQFLNLNNGAPDMDTAFAGDPDDIIGSSFSLKL